MCVSTKKVTALIVETRECPKHGPEFRAHTEDIEITDFEKHDVSGPAQVSTAAYRRGWNMTFGPRGQA